MNALLALTLWQPWCTLVADGDKPPENRPWPPPASLIGQRFALHAGLRYDLDAVPWIEGRLGRRCPSETEVPRGAIIATATLGGYRRWGQPSWMEEPLPPEVAKWCTGPFCWLPVDIVKIEPVPCRGAQKLWRVPDKIAEEVTRRAAVARSAA